MKYKGPIELVGVWDNSKGTTYLTPTEGSSAIEILGEEPKRIYPDSQWAKWRLHYPESTHEHSLPIAPPLPGDILDCFVGKKDRGPWLAKPAFRHKVVEWTQ